MAFFLTDLPLSKINQVLHPVFVPYFARIRDSRQRTREHFALYTLAVTSATFPVLLGLAAVAPRAVEVVLGDVRRAPEVGIRHRQFLGPTRGWRLSFG